MLANPSEKGMSMDCLKELWVQGQYVESVKGSYTETLASQGLGLLRDTDETLGRQTL